MAGCQVGASAGRYWNVTATASVKLFAPPASLYQAWKPYVLTPAIDRTRYRPAPPVRFLIAD